VIITLNPSAGDRCRFCMISDRIPKCRNEGFKVSHIIEQLIMLAVFIYKTHITAALESIIVRIRLLEFSYLFYSSKSNESG